MKIKDAIRQAVVNRNAERAGHIADFLRFSCGLNYQQICELVNRETGIDAASWDALLYEADSHE